MLQVNKTIYITDPGTSLKLSNHALQIEHESGKTDRVPLHLLEKILVFSPHTITLPLMSYCAGQGIGLICLGANGRLKFRVEGETRGNVLTRMRQYTMQEDEKLALAKKLILAKLDGQAENLSRFLRNHPDRAADELLSAEQELRRTRDLAAAAADRDELRGTEGCAANVYFSVFDHLLLTSQEAFHFTKRTRRPPEDRCNALLSFAYTLLTHDCIAAAESFGMDPYVGVLHGEKPGKPAMALDLMEPFRPVMADRFVCRLINLGMLKAEMFEPQEEGGLYLSPSGRSIFLQEWNRMKQREKRMDPNGKSVPIGILPYLQAQRLAAYLRGEAELNVDSSVQIL